jgi:hypothetical protein
MNFKVRTACGGTTIRRISRSDHAIFFVVSFVMGPLGAGLVALPGGASGCRRQRRQRRWWLDSLLPLRSTGAPAAPGPDARLPGGAAFDLLTRAAVRRALYLRRQRHLPLWCPRKWKGCGVT